MRAHKLAPPDAGFAARLRDLAEAAATEQVAWEHAHAAGLLWRPVPGAESAAPPYELRPGTGRRGPAPLWERFDAAVAALNHAITGLSAAEVADAFGEFSEAAGALATAVAAEDGLVSARGSRRRVSTRWAHVPTIATLKPGEGLSTGCLLCAKLHVAQSGLESTRGGQMPQIIVTADGQAGERAVTFRERVCSDFESEHFAAQLVERLGWAVGDADEVQRHRRGRGSGGRGMR